MKLTLFLKHKHFKEIKNGKDEEYRELTPYWVKRLIKVSRFHYFSENVNISMLGKENPDAIYNCIYSVRCCIRKIDFNKFSIIDLRDGYSKVSLLRGCEGITIKKGCEIDHEFCKDDKYYFVIKLNKGGKKAGW